MLSSLQLFVVLPSCPLILGPEGQLEANRQCCLLLHKFSKTEYNPLQETASLRSLRLQISKTSMCQSHLLPLLAKLRACRSMLQGFPV